MSKKLKLVVILSVLLLSLGLVIQAHAETATIASVQSAEAIAADAGGTFVAGSTAPALTGNQVALPILEEGTGQVLGHIVADNAALAAALESAGYAEVAAAVAATEAGAAGGAAAGIGVAAGTATAGVVGAAGATTLVLQGSTGGTTTHH